MGLFDEVLDKVGEPFGGGKGFTYGTHEVIIGDVEATTKKTKTVDAAEVIIITVFDETDNDRQAKCTLWFHTEGGAKIGVAKVLGLLVHNVGEEKKEAVRELGKKLFASIDDPKKARDVAVKLIQDKLLGKKAYLVAEPNGKYPTTSFGDIWHYPAEPQGDPADMAQATAKAVGGSVADDLDVPDFDSKAEDL